MKQCSIKQGTGAKAPPPRREQDMTTQAMIIRYKDEELLDLFAELKIDLSNPNLHFSPTEFKDNADELEIVKKEILKRMREGSRI